MPMIPVAEGCTRCPALIANRNRIVHGYGSQEARVVFIGEAPGCRGGDLTGVPFTRDRSGIRLQQLLINLGLSAEADPCVEQPHLRCFVTNVVRCNPPANRTPTRAEIANCQPYLWQELALLKSRIVVPMGNVATQVLFLGLKSQPAPPISLAHAQIYAENSVQIVPMRHPARISNADMQRFITVLRPLLQTIVCSEPPPAESESGRSNKVDRTPHLW